jgi:WD40 repeat protein
MHACMPYLRARRAHDNTKFVSSGGDRSVFLWDVTTGNTIRRISAHLAKINVVEFNNDASVVASGKCMLVFADGHTRNRHRFLRLHRQTVGSSVRIP